MSNELPLHVKNRKTIRVLVFLLSAACAGCGKEKGNGAPPDAHIKFDSYLIRQPVSPEVREHAAKLGIKVTPYYESTTVAMVVMPEGKANPEFINLLHKASANEATAAAERNAWWIKHKGRIAEFTKAIEADPEVLEAAKKREKRLAEISKMKALTQDEYDRLMYEMATEYNKVVFRVSLRLEGGPSTPEAREFTRSFYDKSK
jgi:hypothetical protein